MDLWNEEVGLDDFEGFLLNSKFVGFYKFYVVYSNCIYLERVKNISSV